MSHLREFRCAIETDDCKRGKYMIVCEPTGNTDDRKFVPVRNLTYKEAKKVLEAVIYAFEMGARAQRENDAAALFEAKGIYTVR